MTRAPRKLAARAELRYADRMGRPSLRGVTRDVSVVGVVAALAASASLPACLSAQRGESQLLALHTGLDREFPDREVADDGAFSVTPRAANPSDRTPSTPTTPTMPPTPPPATRWNGPSPDSTRLAMSAPDATIGPVGSQENAESEARPLIRIVGTARANDARRPVGRRADDRIEMTLPDEGAPAAGSAAVAAATTPAAVDAAARASLDHAMALVAAHDCDAALGALGAFLVEWPDHPGAEGATFARASCYLARGELVQALEDYEVVLARFPKGAKVADTLLGLGLVEQRLGNAGRARGYLERLGREFPASDAARRAPRLPAAPPAT